MEPHVCISEGGRDGEVIYRDAFGEQTFYWEIGGGDVVAIVHVGTEAEWRVKALSTADRRPEILRFVASEVVRQKSPSCRADIDDHAGLNYLRDGAAGNQSP